MARLRGAASYARDLQATVADAELARAKKGSQHMRIQSASQPFASHGASWTDADASAFRRAARGTRGRKTVEVTPLREWF